MDKTIDCKDLKSGCTFTACTATEAELLDKIQEHGRTVHGMKEFSPDFYDKVQKSIREAYCELDDELESCECCC